MSGDAETVERAMREIAAERPDLLEVPAGHETLADLDEELDAAYWRAVEERYADIRCRYAAGRPRRAVESPRPGWVDVETRLDASEASSGIRN